MKRFGLWFASMLVLAGSLLPAATASAATALVANGGFESGSSAPAGWHTNAWGALNASYTYETTGHGGGKSVTTTVSGYSNGDAKWYHDALQVTAGAAYTFNDWYKSTAKTSVGVASTNASGVTSYYWLGDPAVATIWTKASYSFKMPADAKTAVFTHYLRANGTLTIDDVEVSNTITTPAAPTVQITSPVANATVSGVASIAATAVDAVSVSQVQFQLDGAALGAPDTAAPYAATWDTTKTANGVHTLTAVATNASSLSTTSGSVAVTVTNSAVTPTPSPTPKPTPSPAPSASLLPNGGVEAATAAVPHGWHDGSWGANTRSLTYESTGRASVHSLKSTITSYSNGDAKWYHDDVAVSANATYEYSDWYMSNVDTEIDAAVTMSDGSVQYYYLTAAPSTGGSWQQLKAQFTTPVGATKVNIFHVIARVGYVQVDDMSLTAYVPAKFSRALVSLTFDDGWRSIYANGLPVLKKYGMPSTQYLLTGTTTYPDYMTVAQMKEFQAQGSEIASHSVDHSDLTTLGATKLDSELKKSQASLRGWMGQSVATNFATPYGAYNTKVVTGIKKYYKSHRSIETGYNAKDSFNIYNIKVQNITHTTTPADVQAWVAQAIATNTWLVLVYHEVDANPEDNTYAVTPANLDAELGIVKQSGITVKTVEQALAEITPQL